MVCKPSLVVPAHYPGLCLDSRGKRGRPHSQKDCSPAGDCGLRKWCSTCTSCSAQGELGVEVSWCVLCVLCGDWQGVHMARHQQHFKASDNLFHHTVTGALQCVHASNWPWQGKKRGSKGPARTSQGGGEFKFTTPGARALQIGCQSQHR